MSSSLAQPTYQFRLVLILGSFDKKTRRSLEALRLSVSQKYAGEGVFAIMLDDVECYSTEEFFVLAEKKDPSRYDIRVFRHDQGLPEETFEVNTRAQSVDEAVRNKLKKELGIPGLSKLPIINKLDTLMKHAKSILIVRERAETRGGEVAETIYALLTGHTEKICFLVRSNVVISEMISEFFEHRRVITRSYTGPDDLCNHAMRFISYRLI